MSLMLFFLSVFALSFIICDSKIFSPIRELLSETWSFFEDLFACYFCVGIWCGSFLYILPTSVFKPLSYVLSGAAVSYFLGKILDLVENVTFHLYSKRGDSDD